MTNNDYVNVVEEIKKQIKRAQHRAILNANKEIVMKK